MDFDIIQRAGLTQQQFAALAGVDRVTVNTWVNNKFAPCAELRPRVSEILRKLEDAVQSGLLPVQMPSKDAVTKQVLACLLDDKVEGE